MKLRVRKIEVPEGAGKPQNEKPEKQQHEIHPEYEEKLIAEEVQKVSEDYHGGSESTMSMPNTKSPSLEEKDEKTGNNTGSGSCEEENGEENYDVPELEEAIDKLGEELERDAEQEGDSLLEPEDEDEEDDVGGSTEDGESNQDISVELPDGEKVEGSTESDANDDDDEHGFSPTRIAEDIVKVNRQRPTTSFLRKQFYGLIERIAEVETNVESHSDFSRYSMRKLMFRRYTGKTPNQCKVGRVREAVILILDTSGSMAWWANLLNELANAALKRKDVDLYMAPNGIIGTRVTLTGSIKADHDEFIKKTKGRRIIYVGDFDGANTPVELSWKNDVVWFCPEERYRRFESHDWVDYNEEDFKGAWFRVYNEEELSRAMRMLIRFRRLWVDFHEEDTFRDDEEYEEDEEGW
ncbi:MAG: hypothetical protein ACTSXC_06740, partial [Candidatus Freyarchaeota archaeon]